MGAPVPEWVVWAFAAVLWAFLGWVYISVLRQRRRERRIARMKEQVMAELVAMREANRGRPVYDQDDNQEDN